MGLLADIFDTPVYLPDGTHLDMVRGPKKPAPEPKPEGTHEPGGTKPQGQDYFSKELAKSEKPDFSAIVKKVEAGEITPGEARQQMEPQDFGGRVE
jgi:hypothetical protein